MNTRRKLILTVTGTLFVFAVLNLATYFYRQATWNAKEWGILRWKWNLAIHAEKPVDWLILGDSAGLRGINPARFRERLGESALNLCGYGLMGIYNQIWILDYYLRHVGAPKNVILIDSVEVWTGDKMNQEWARIPLDWNAWVRLDPTPFSSLVLRPVTCFEVLLLRSVPLYAGNPIKVFLSRYSLGKQTFLLDNGFEGLIYEGPRVLKDEVVNHDFFPHGTDVSEISKMSLVRISQMAEKGGFNVWIVPQPLPDAAIGAEPFHSKFSKLRLSMMRAVAGEPRLNYLDDFGVLPEAYFYDSGHVHLGGANQYTDQLIDRLKLEIEKFDAAVGVGEEK